MDERTARLESSVEQLRLSVRSLQQRLDALEAAALGGAGAAADGAAAKAREPAPYVSLASSRAKDPYDPIAMLSSSRISGRSTMS